MWTQDQVTDTNRFVETMSPVIEDPWVQSALADRISQEVLTYVDVQQIANEAVDALAAQGLRPQLVDRLRDLTGPLADGVAGLVRDRVGQLVASLQFTAAWNRAVQVAHEQANAVLSDGSFDRDQGRNGCPRPRSVHRRREAALASRRSSHVLPRAWRTSGADLRLTSLLPSWLAAMVSYGDDGPHPAGMTARMEALWRVPARVPHPLRAVAHP